LRHRPPSETCASDRICRWMASTHSKPLKSIRRNAKAVSPAISMIIITAAVLVLVLAAMSYALNYMTIQMAGDEFSSNEQFMQSAGLQIDNVAWTIGRTETVDYSAKYGQVNFTSNVLNYTFKINYNNGAGWQPLYNSTTGVILFNMPVRDYNLGNNYFSRILPANNGSFLQWNASAPVSQVFVTQESPMKDGSYGRIVVVPIVRVLNSTMVTGVNCYKFYFPSLVTGSYPYATQSLTLTGVGLTQLSPISIPLSNSAQIQISATALAPPSNPPGFSSSFFNFDHATETVNIPAGSLVEIFIGSVSVSVGVT